MDAIEAREQAAILPTKCVMWHDIEETRREMYNNPPQEVIDNLKRHISESFDGKQSSVLKTYIAPNNIFWQKSFNLQQICPDMNVTEDPKHSAFLVFTKK